MESEDLSNSALVASALFWCNHYLRKEGVPEVESLTSDFTDGEKLCVVLRHAKAFVGKWKDEFASAPASSYIDKIFSFLGSVGASDVFLKNVTPEKIRAGDLISTLSLLMLISEMYDPESPFVQLAKLEGLDAVSVSQGKIHTSVSKKRHGGQGNTYRRSRRIQHDGPESKGLSVRGSEGGPEPKIEPAPTPLELKDKRAAGETIILGNSSRRRTNTGSSADTTPMEEGRSSSSGKEGTPERGKEVVSPRKPPSEGQSPRAKRPGSDLEMTSIERRNHALEFMRQADTSDSDDTNERGRTEGPKAADKSSAKSQKQSTLTQTPQPQTRKPGMMARIFDHIKGFSSDQADVDSDGSQISPVDDGYKRERSDSSSGHENLVLSENVLDISRRGADLVKMDLSRAQRLEFNCSCLLSVPVTLFAPSFKLDTTLKYLDLSCNMITMVPEKMMYFTSLHTLKFDMNLIDLIPHTVFSMKSLRVLSFNNCGLNALYISETREISPLTRLSIAHNAFTIFPTDILKMKLLSELNLSFNQLERVPYALFNLPSLRKLDLSHNKITSISSKIGMAFMNEEESHLEDVDLSWNLLTDISSEVLSMMSRVREINISNNQFKEMPDFSRLCSRLNTLTACGNNMEICEFHAPMDQLHTLDISRNKLKTVPDLSFLPKLWSLHLGYNPFTDIPSLFNDSINEISLCGCGLSRLPVLVCPKLGRIDVSNNRLTSPCLDSISSERISLFDISYNKIDCIPFYCTKQGTEIEYIIWEGNPYSIPSSSLILRGLDSFPKTPLSVGLAETRKATDTDKQSVITVIGNFGPNADMQYFSLVTGITSPFDKTLSASLMLSKTLEKTDEEEEHFKGEAFSYAFHAAGSVYDYYGKEAKSKKKKAICGGCDGLVCIFSEGCQTVTVANAGMNCAVLSRQGKPIFLSKAHSPFNPEEYLDLLKRQGKVDSRGIISGYATATHGIGFRDLDNAVSDEVAISEMEIDLAIDEFIIIGSASLWNIVPPERALKIVSESLSRGENATSVALELQEACNDGKKRELGDVSIIVIALPASIKSLPIRTKEEKHGSGKPKHKK